MSEQVQWLTIDSEQAGQRIDNFLSKICKGVPTSHLYKLLRAGSVRVNKKRIDANYRLQTGDLVRLPPLRTAAPELPVVHTLPPIDPLPILFEDEALLIVDKPAGLAVHGGSGLAFGVIEQLRQQRPDAKLLELVHRLDRDTSGILVVAKKRSALVHLHEQWRLGTPQKNYLALVSGRWDKTQEDVRLPLYKYVDAKGERRVRVDGEQGQAARTVFSVHTRYREFTLVRALLKTGRTHQIRVHLAALGTPVVGDERYGDFALNKRLLRADAQPHSFKRMFLHAQQLRLIHPVSLEPLTIKAELPLVCRAFLAALSTSDIL